MSQFKMYHIYFPSKETEHFDLSFVVTKLLQRIPLWAGGTLPFCLMLWNKNSLRFLANRNGSDVSLFLFGLLIDAVTGVSMGKCRKILETFSMSLTIV